MSIIPITNKLIIFKFSVLVDILMILISFMKNLINENFTYSECVENSVKNKEKIYDSIINAAAAAQTNPQPSTIVHRQTTEIHLK